MSSEKLNNFKRPDNSGKQQDQVLGASSGGLFGKIRAPFKNENKVQNAPAQPVAQPVSQPVAKQEEPRVIKSLPNTNNNKPFIGKIRNPQEQNKTVVANKPAVNNQRKTQNTPVQKQEPKAPVVAQTTTVNTAENKQQENRPQQNRNNNYNNRNKFKRYKNNSKAPAKKPSIKAYFLGGLNEIGKNFTLFECEDEMIIVDCGLAFPDDDMLGIDIVIPDFTFVEQNIDKIKAVVITHGHEDHIGSLPYLLKKFKLPIYGTPLAMGLLQVKLKEHNLHNQVTLNSLSAGSKFKLGCFDIEMIHVNHSIPDAVALAIHSPAGVIVHTGDFKIDFTPSYGKMIDLHRFAELGKEGVLALMADSTNVERAGYTTTEAKVAETLSMLFDRADKKRIIVATFASNISRVQQIINCAIKNKRKVAFSGRSMINVVAIARELGYIQAPDELFVDLSVINRYPKEQIVLITTGSQGEPMAALSRMAYAEHRQVEVGEDDFIIISARPIPGNEKTVGSVVDELLKRGCDIVYESMYEVHVSGHACQEELKLIHCLVKPQYFIPVHGEQKHLRKHAELAMGLGMSKDNIFIGDIGKGIELNKDFMKPTNDVPAGEVMVDGIGVGDVGSIVLRDRKHLAEDGLIIAVCSIESGSGHILSGPDIVSRGFVYVRESEELMNTAKKMVYSAVEDCAEEGVTEWGAIKLRIRDVLSKLMYEKTRRRPMILPIIMEI